MSLVGSEVLNVIAASVFLRLPVLDLLDLVPHLQGLIEAIAEVRGKEVIVVLRTTDHHGGDQTRGSGAEDKAGEEVDRAVITEIIEIREDPIAYIAVVGHLLTILPVMACDGGDVSRRVPGHIHLILLAEYAIELTAVELEVPVLLLTTLPSEGE